MRTVITCWALACLSVTSPFSNAQDPAIPPCPELKRFHTAVVLTDNGDAAARIVVPDGSAYRSMGERIAKRVAAVSGVSLPLRSASEVSGDTLADGNAILLGYFANNPLIERLYDRYLVTCDAGYPGAGGHVVRTVHDPLGAGTSFVYLGGADPEAVERAVAAFLETLPDNGDIAVGHRVQVFAADGTPLYTPSPERIAARIEAAREKNFRTCASLLVSAGVGYYRTGNPDDLHVFKGIAPLFRETFRQLGQIDDMRGAVYLANVWDAIEEAPLFSASDRAWMTDMLWEFTWRFSHPRRRTADPGDTPAGNDWNARVTADLGRYWYTYYGLDPNGVHSWARERFTAQAAFWRSKEDCPGYGGMAMYDILYYVLPNRHTVFWDSGNGRRMADYGVAVMNNLGGHAGFGDTSSMGSIGHWADIFRVAAWKLRDGRYLVAEAHSSGAGRGSADFFYNNYMQNEIAPQTPDDMLGIHVVPLPDWVYTHREEVLGTAPPFMNSALDADTAPPREHCFDKITLRSSMEPDDPYIILGGISHGYHAHPDGNAIIEMTDAGRYCLFDSGYFVPDTIEHNTLVVFRNGLFEPIPRLTGLRHLADFDGIGITQTYLNHYNGADWQRTLIWLKNKYTLVLDDVVAQEPGNYAALAVFRTLDDHTPEVQRDRVRTLYRGQPFCLVSASQARIKVTDTRPPASTRYAVIQSKSSDLKPGDSLTFSNLLYTEPVGSDWTYDIVPLGPNAVLLRGVEEYALAATGPLTTGGNLLVDAAVSHVTPTGFALVGGRTLAVGATWFAADVPVTIQVQLGERASGIVETDRPAVIRLYADADGVSLDGNTVSVREGPEAVELDLPVGRHTIGFTPRDMRLAADWQQLYDTARQHHDNAQDALQSHSQTAETMTSTWEIDNAALSTRQIMVTEEGTPVRDLTPLGKPMAWTEAQKGAGVSRGADGNLDTYAATPSRLPWTADLPKDFGMVWTAPVAVGMVQISYYDKNYAPTMGGQQLQAWDGEAWQPVKSAISREMVGTSSYETPVPRWTYTFEPVTTTRIRIFISEFAQARTAVREFRAFAEAGVPRDQTVRTPHPTTALLAVDINGDGADEILVGAGTKVKAVDGHGTVLWEKTLTGPVLTLDAFNLDGEGNPEIVAGTRDQYVHCLDHAGELRWSVRTPADPFTPDREPMRGAVEVLRCADLDGDGDGEIVLGSGNWFAYAYDHKGELLWRALNWAHHPTAIAFATLGDGKQAALIGTTYNDANLFGPDGSKLDLVNVGYHGAAMSVAAGDLDRDGVVELIAGSRVGGLHLKQLGGDRTWTTFMGAEVTDVVLVDLDGNGDDEIVAASRNFYVLATTARGDILWNTNVGDAALDLAVLNDAATGRPAIAVATEGGMVRLLGHDGTILATTTIPGDATHVAVAYTAGTDKRPTLVAGSSDGRIHGGITWNKSQRQPPTP